MYTGPFRLVTKKFQTTWYIYLLFTNIKYTQDFYNARLPILQLMGSTVSNSGIYLSSIYLTLIYLSIYLGVEDIAFSILQRNDRPVDPGPLPGLAG